MKPSPTKIRHAPDAPELLKDRLIDLAHTTFGPASARKMDAMLHSIPDTKRRRLP